MVWAYDVLLVQPQKRTGLDALRVVGLVAPDAGEEHDGVAGDAALEAVVQGAAELAVAVGIVIFEQRAVLDTCRMVEFVALRNTALDQLTLFQENEGVI